ncbi:hypothetical protein LZ198_15135 [Myxococcus sp. K15C18031901]|uniref:hypothetical protein n=1 Tax=Myxococcus dinghuensis TaxID=2906761 RepID=UPI0020A7E929|nr:hypothetical protein [Myxococcus dinghuensis]MCP3100205.1 hypothetical protein [Myxococcus dinghuensis]
MKTPFIRLLTALPLTALLGCDSGALVEPAVLDTRAAPAVTTGFVFDASSIATPPTGGLPANLLARTAFDDSALQGALIGSTEAFSQTDVVGSRRDLESRTWLLESDPSEGQALVLNKLGAGPATPQEPAVLQRTAVARLQRWGIPASEMGPILQVKTYTQAEADGVLAAPELHRYKTFVMRAINGIRVEGHRAVVTHGVDGTFQRALIAWPPLARTGHLLRTRLATADIEQRAREALVAEGESSGNVRLFWKYVPARLATGEWALALRVGAAMPAVDGVNGTEEPRVVDVDVSAIP